MKTCTCNIQNWKKYNILNIFAQSIDCGYSLEPHLTEAVLTSTHIICFGSKNEKNRYTPVYPSSVI